MMLVRFGRLWLFILGCLATAGAVFLVVYLAVGLLLVAFHVPFEWAANIGMAIGVTAAASAFIAAVDWLSDRGWPS